MANTFITPQMVANEALAILRNNCVYKDLVHTDYSGDFVGAVGDTVNVRVPASLVAKDFVTTIDAQTLTESSVPVKLDRFKDVTVEITAKDWTLEIKDFAKQVIAPAVAAIGEAIDQDIANKIFEKAGNTVSRTAATPTTLGDFANVAKALDINKAPKMDRSLVMSPYHKYVYAQLDHLVKGSYAGDNDLLRRNEIGPVYGIDTFMDQNTPTSTAATSGTATGTITVASSTDAGEVDLTAGSAATATFKAGDGFVYGGILYRFSADATLSGSVLASVAVTPVFPAGVSAIAVPIVRNGSSLAFHKDAFAFVNRPLAIPQGAAKSAVATADGLSVRVIFDYDATYKKDIVSFDILYGVKELRTGLAVRLVDGTLA